MSRIAVITGTTHGIGRVTARELAAVGFTVVMLCRDIEAATEVREEIQRTVPSASVHAQRCDLASLASVRACAAEVRRNFASVALLINNAGMVSTRHRMSVDGYELTFASNHLGPFLLTGLLLDRMAAGGRIVNVASRAHYRGVMDLENIDKAQAPYDARAAYARSKLANVLHTFALARRLAGTGVTANCLHPGIVATNLLPRWLRVVQRLITRHTFDAVRGARTTLYLALANEAAAINGRYFDEHQHAQSASALANDPEMQELLWAASVRWTSVDAHDTAHDTAHDMAPQRPAPAQKKA
ncbi:MAG TPA: SDR family oxidoreductase [Steroidobacteraceae bacterium]|nr:SDR family oxidoreductase [Steroidobacteraceae bacterium]